MLARQIARDRDEHLLLRRIINKHTVLSQLNAALFRLIPLQLCPRTCLYSRYSRVLDKAAKNCGKGPPPWGLQRPGTHVNRLQKFLSEFEELYPVLSIYRQYPPDNPDNTA